MAKVEAFKNKAAGQPLGEAIYNLDGWLSWDQQKQIFDRYVRRLESVNEMLIKASPITLAIRVPVQETRLETHDVQDPNVFVTYSTERASD